MYRKPLILIVILICAFVFFSCAPKKIISRALVRAHPGDKLFATAQRLFEQHFYDRALESYEEYLARFPEGPLVPAAIMKIGDIYSAQGNYSLARKSYIRLIEGYPDSYLVWDAQIAILAAYYNEGSFNEVIAQAPSLLQQLISREHIIRTYVLLGDSFYALGSNTDAVLYFLEAYQLADVHEQRIIDEKIKQSVLYLESEKIQSLLDFFEDRAVKGHILYLTGVAKAEVGKYEDAVNVLALFIDNFPENEKSQTAADLIREIEKLSLYSRHTIGCLLPLSGPYKIYGKRAQEGIELAMSRFNSQGIAPPIKVIFKDTGSDLNKAVEAVNELANEEVAAIIGPIFTAESAAVTAQQKGIPIVTITQKDKITDIGDYVFRNFFTPAMQVNRLVSFAVEELELSSFAILYPEDDYGKLFMNIFWDEVIAYGGQIVGIESYKTDQTDFADSIKKLVGLFYELPEDLKKKSICFDEGEKNIEDNIVEEDTIFGEDNVVVDVSEDNNLSDEDQKDEEEPTAIVDFDAVFIPDDPKRAGLIVPQLAYYDVSDVYIFGTNLWHSDELVKMARQYVQGAVMPDIFFDESFSKIVREFVEDFENTYNEKPGFIEAAAYDTAMMLFDIISRPEVKFRSSIRDGLINLKDFCGVTGRTSFDSNGDVVKELYLLEIKGDGFKEIQDFR